MVIVYRCSHCGYILAVYDERLQPPSSKTRAICPRCGAKLSPKPKLIIIRDRWGRVLTIWEPRHDK